MGVQTELRQARALQQQAAQQVHGLGTELQRLADVLTAERGARAEAEAQLTVLEDLAALHASQSAREGEARRLRDALGEARAALAAATSGQASLRAELADAREVEAMREMNGPRMLKLIRGGSRL